VTSAPWHPISTGIPLCDRPIRREERRNWPWPLNVRRSPRKRPFTASSVTSEMGQEVMLAPSTTFSPLYNLTVLCIVVVRGQTGRSFGCGSHGAC
jgi:hypothetical protein